MEMDSSVIHILNLEDKDFKEYIINIFKELKEGSDVRKMAN